MIRVEKLNVRAGDFRMNDVTFEIPTGTYGVLMGKSGSGKTTILEQICGLKPIDSGTIVLSGRDVTHARPAERGVGYVPQDTALFTTMSVREHLAFALVIRKWTAADINKRVEELATLLGITDLLDRDTHGLSGGESQRVALGRALSCYPDVLCLDEPLSSLDEETREETYDLLKSVQKYTGVTTLHVTHSVSEAKRLGDCILTIKDGRIR